MRYYQQGDVLLRPVDVVPHKATKATDNVVAYGEATGHKHKLVGTAAAKYVLEAAIYIRCLHEAKLLHEEHKALLIPPGNYQVDFVREYDHFAEEAKRVED